MVDEVWRLEEVEETVLLEVFVASLGKAKASAAAAKKVRTFSAAVTESRFTRPHRVKRTPSCRTPRAP